MIKKNLHTQPVLIKDLKRYFWFDHGVLLQADMDQTGRLWKSSIRTMPHADLNEISILNNRLGLKLDASDFKKKTRLRST